MVEIDNKRYTVHTRLLVNDTAYSSYDHNLRQRGVDALKNSIIDTIHRNGYLRIWINPTGKVTDGKKDGYELLLPARMVARTIFTFTVTEEI